MTKVTRLTPEIRHRKESPIPASTDLESIAALVKDDLAAINRHIEIQMRSDVALIRTIGSYIIEAGGKRLRPLTLLLGARALAYTGSAHIDLGVVIEFIHTATLLHDDVVDKSDLRRGQDTANAIWGNAASVLVGDFLYSRAFEMMVAVDRMRVMEIMAKTTNSIAEGEVLQLLNTHSPDVTEQEYLDTITRKTAKLFESSAQLGAVLAEAGPATEFALAEFGLNIGIAFQIVDDELDYRSETGKLGKNAGDDLADGKITLPLIHALQQSSSSDQSMIRSAITDGDRDRLLDVQRVIESTGALAYTSRRARDHVEYAKRALQILPPSDHRNALSSMADFAVSRTH